LFGLFSVIIGQFSPVYIHGRVSDEEQFLESQAAFEKLWPLAGGDSWNKLPEEDY
jgi:hypothetical protein